MATQHGPPSGMFCGIHTSVYRETSGPFVGAPRPQRSLTFPAPGARVQVKPLCWRRPLSSKLPGLLPRSCHAGSPGAARVVREGVESLSYSVPLGTSGMSERGSARAAAMQSLPRSTLPRSNLRRASCEGEYMANVVRRLSFRKRLPAGTSSSTSRTAAPSGKKSGCWRTSRSDRRDSRDLRMLRVRERTICVSLVVCASWSL